MKNLILAVLAVTGITLLATLSLSPNRVHAFDPFPKGPNSVCTTQTQSSSVCSLDGKNPISGTEKEGIILKAVNLLSYITGVAAVIAIVIAGFEYVISTGNSEKISKSKDAILYAVIGLIVVLSAQIIVRLIVSQV